MEIIENIIHPRTLKWKIFIPNSESSMREKFVVTPKDRSFFNERYVIEDIDEFVERLELVRVNENRKRVHSLGNEEHFKNSIKKVKVDSSPFCHVADVTYSAINLDHNYSKMEASCISSSLPAFLMNENLKYGVSPDFRRPEPFVESKKSKAHIKHLSSKKILTKNVTNLIDEGSIWHKFLLEFRRKCSCLGCCSRFCGTCRRCSSGRLWRCKISTRRCLNEVVYPCSSSQDPSEANSASRKIEQTKRDNINLEIKARDQVEEDDRSYDEVSSLIIVASSKDVDSPVNNVIDSSNDGHVQFESTTSSSKMRLPESPQFERTLKIDGSIVSKEPLSPSDAYRCKICGVMPRSPNRSELYRHYSNIHFFIQLREDFGSKKECPICDITVNGGHTASHFGQKHNMVEKYLPKWARVPTSYISAKMSPKIEPEVDIWVFPEVPPEGLDRRKRSEKTKLVEYQIVKEFKMMSVSQWMIKTDDHKFDMFKGRETECKICGTLMDTLEHGVHHMQQEHLIFVRDGDIASSLVKDGYLIMSIKKKRRDSHTSGYDSHTTNGTHSPNPTQL